MPVNYDLSVVPENLRDRCAEDIVEILEIDRYSTQVKDAYVRGMLQAYSRISNPTQPISDPQSPPSQVVPEPVSQIQVKGVTASGKRSILHAKIVKLTGVEFQSGQISSGLALQLISDDFIDTEWDTSVFISGRDLYRISNAMLDSLRIERERLDREARRRENLTRAARPRSRSRSRSTGSGSRSRSRAQNAESSLNPEPEQDLSSGRLSEDYIAREIEEAVSEAQAEIDATREAERTTEEDFIRLPDPFRSFSEEQISEILDLVTRSVRPPDV